MQIDKQQIKRIHFLLRSAQLEPQKAALVFGFSGKRTESTKDLTYNEAAQMIAWLQQEANKQDGANKMRRKILSICHHMNWEKENGKVDMDRLENWCVTKSYLKKPFNEYTYEELPKLVSQIQIVYSHLLKFTTAHKS